MKIAFDVDEMKPACPILQAAMGGTVSVGEFDSKHWLTSMTPGLKLYPVTAEQLEKLIAMTEIYNPQSMEAIELNIKNNAYVESNKDFLRFKNNILDVFGWSNNNRQLLKQLCKEYSNFPFNDMLKMVLANFKLEKR